MNLKIIIADVIWQVRCIHESILMSRRFDCLEMGKNPQMTKQKQVNMGLGAQQARRWIHGAGKSRYSLGLEVSAWAVEQHHACLLDMVDDSLPVSTFLSSQILGIISLEC